MAESSVYDKLIMS